MFKRFSILISAFFYFLFPLKVFAHENYVLTKQQIDNGMNDYSLNILDSLKNPENLKIGVFVTFGLIILMISYFFFQKSKYGLILHEKLEKLESFGAFLIRIAIGFSFLYSAFTNVYLGPEIPTSSLLFGNLIHFSLFIIGFLLILGLLNNLTGFLSLLIILIATITYKDYMITYFNYYGEFIALMLFGSTFLAFDKFLPDIVGKFTKNLKKFEIPILRITYGVSVLYPAISIKILHPIIIVGIVNKYHLEKLNWLFPSDPLLISLGTGLAQILVGLLLIVGFETRLASFLTFLLYVGSVIFFKEVVWPHYILLALALYFVINNGGKYTLDEIFIKKWKKS